jgi:pimeloyl-ACP methyl ester carboxylesterase/DNA-binding CsgD family transcriptional regulator
MPHLVPQVRFCKSRDGTRIAYAVWGQGPPLIWATHWVHNLKFDRDSPVWRPWLAALSRRNSVICYDWRGCGLSDREPGDFSFERHVEDLESVVEAAKLRRFAYLGMANGAAIGMAYASKHPGRLSHLILYASWVRGRLRRKLTRDQIVEAETRLKVIGLGWSKENPAYEQFFTSLHMPDASDEQARSYNNQIRSATSPTNAVKLLSVFFQMDLSEIVPQIDCPTLVLHARNDSAISFDEGVSVAELIKDARFVPLESRNHVLLEGEPAWEQFTSEIDNFLAVPVGESAILGDMAQALTAREHQVIELIALGLDNEAISRKLGISKKTVRNQVSSVLKKVGAKNRVEAVVRARDAGLGRSKG